MELKGISESSQQKKRFRMLVFVLLMMLIFFLITIFLVSADTNRDDSSLDFSLLSKRGANYGADPHSLVFQPVSLDILFEILKDHYPGEDIDERVQAVVDQLSTPFPSPEPDTEPTPIPQPTQTEEPPPIIYKPVVIPPRCGDSVLNGGEECDDGNTISGDGCTGTCRIEACGNNIVDAGEQCDPPNGTTCNASCQNIAIVCGNSILQPGEQCDPPNGTTCDASCQDIPIACGNSIVQPGEQCDPPDGTTCDASCQNIPVVCGNGIIQPGEECDDGNTSAGDGCSPTCTNEVCGNSIVDFGEDCDPPNGITCDASCQNIPIECGNNILQPGEECDDGNLADGDGCSSICEIEAATECTDVSLDNYQAAGKWVSWEISNSSGLPIVIDTIEINWPLDMEELFKIKLDNFNIWLGSETVPPSLINSGWIGDEDDRTIGVGMTEVIDFEFTINVDPSGFSTSITFPALNCYASDTQ